MPPTILSPEAAREGLALTLMERLLKSWKSREFSFVRMLAVQYRMNEKIMEFPSKILYENRLEAADSVRKRLLADLEGVEKNEITSAPLFLIDSAGCEFCKELQTPSEISKGNLGEVKLVFAHVRSLIEAGLPQTGIAIISPYNLQIALLRSCVQSKFPKVEIRSVDGYQGQEREAVVLSLVRSNNKGKERTIKVKKRTIRLIFLTFVFNKFLFYGIKLIW